MANQTNQSLKSNNPPSTTSAASSLIPDSVSGNISTPASSTSLEGSSYSAAIVANHIGLGGGGGGPKPTVAARPSTLPTGKPPPLGRTSRSATRAASGTSGGAGFSSQLAGMRVFKKCKSATFQIDGHTYTIGELIRGFVFFY